MTRVLGGLLFWLGLILVVVATWLGPSLTGVDRLRVIAVVSTVAALYAWLKLLTTRDPFLAAGWRGWFLGPPISIPHSWWWFVAVVWTIVAIVTAAQAGGW